MSGFDLIIIAGATGAGKSTVCELLHQRLGGVYIEFSRLREFHLDRQWSNQSPGEEQMAFENLLAILANYFSHGYTNIIVTDLRENRVYELVYHFSSSNVMLVSLILNDEQELRRRIGSRTEGFRDIDVAVAWNRRVRARPLMVCEHRFDSGTLSAQQIVEKLVPLAWPV